MPRRVPRAGLLPASRSKTALLTIAIMSGTGLSQEARDLGEVPLAEHGIDHVNVRRVAGEVGLEVIAIARLRCDAVTGAVVEDRAEPPAIGARDGRARVDDQAGDALLMLVAQHAALVGALGEALLL